MTTVISGSSPSITFSDATTQTTAFQNASTQSITSINTFGFKNRIINGGMVIDQRNAGASVTLTSGGVFVIDRFNCYSNNDGVMTGQQDTSAPSGFINSMKFTTTTADSSLAATQYAEVQQIIEGLNIADLAWGTASAATINVSFWVRSSLIGAFGGAIRNSANNRSYAFSYSISTANTWEQKSVTIAGDTSGTWLTTNGIGIKLCFGMGAGSTYSGTAGVWTAGVLVQPTGATSVVGTLNATWYVTGVQLEVGTQATSFDFRDYGRELILCQRYYQKITNGVTDRGIGVGFFYTSSVMVSQIPFQVNMRSSPTLDVNSGSNYFIIYSNSSGTPMNTVTLNDATPYTGAVTASSLSGTSGSAGQFKSNNASSSLAFTAEL